MNKNIVSLLSFFALLICLQWSVQAVENETEDETYQSGISLPILIKAKDNSTTTPEEPKEFTLSSIAVVDGEILEAYKCENKVNGVEKSIPLSWENVPEAAGSLAIIMHHYPFPEDTSIVSLYLLLWGIDPSVTGIPHGEADDGDWFMGANKDANAISYTSPCSPGAATHEYTITLYALSETPPFLPTESSIEITYSILLAAFEDVTIIDTATLTFNDVTE